MGGIDWNRLEKRATGGGLTDGSLAQERPAGRHVASQPAAAELASVKRAR